MTIRQDQLLLSKIKAQAKPRVIRELIERRVALGLTQDELAADLGVAPNTISNWESLAYKPRLDHLELWAEGLGLRVAFVEDPEIPRRPKP